MKRRQFTALAATATLGLGLQRVAFAQATTPVTAADYQKLATPIPVSTPPGMVDVVEFFSFACPHCNEFEPVLEPWLKTKPAYIRFRRSPVPFLMNFRNFQPMYFALDTLGVVDSMQKKVFDAVHKEHVRFDTPDQIAAFMEKNGVDAKKFMGVYSSFGNGVKVTQGNQLFQATGADGVPTLMVGGRFLTSPTIVKTSSIPESERKTLVTIETLAAQIHAGH